MSANEPEDAERAVVGAALLDAQSIRWSSEHVSPDDFSNARLGAVYGVIVQLSAAGKPTDPIAVDAAARESGIRGVTTPDLFDLLSSTPTAANAGYYARLVYEAAVRRRLAQFGHRAMQLSEAGTDLSEIMTAVRGEFDGVRGEVAAPLAAKTLGEVLEGSDEYDWFIPGLLERQDRLIITGAEGGGKTTFVRQLVILASAGLHPMKFDAIDPVRVLVVDAENTERQWRRAVRGMVSNARLNGAADPTKALHVACVPRLDITREKDLGAVHRLIDEHEPDLLAIGPLYKLTPRAITSDDDAAPLINALDSLRARNIALVMEAHAGHAQNAGGERNLRPRGSSALLGWPEFGFGLAKDPDDPKVRHVVRWRGDRDERAWPQRLRWGATYPFMDDTEEPGAWE